MYVASLGIDYLVDAAHVHPELLKVDTEGNNYC
jgi:hypothetical protein